MPQRREHGARCDAESGFGKAADHEHHHAQAQRRVEEVHRERLWRPAAARGHADPA